MENKVNNDNKNVIRLVYVGISSYNSYGDGKKIGEMVGASSIFVLPGGMSLENSYKVISYLSEKVEKENGLEPCSMKSVSMVSKILENYGFERIDGIGRTDFHATLTYTPFGMINIPLVGVKGCVDLYTVNGDFDLFKRSNLYKYYFEWFTENVKESEFNQIIGKKTR